MELPLAIDTVDGTFWLAVIVLLAAVGLTIFAVWKSNDNSKQVFAIVGVLLGLFGAGGLGSLFAKQAANEAADQAAPEAAAAAVSELGERQAPPANQNQSEKSPDNSSKSGNKGGAK